MFPLFISLLLAQPGEVRFHGAVLNEAISLPSAERLFTGFNPGAEAGVEWRWLRGQHVDLVQDVSAVFVHHPGLSSWAVLETSALGRWRAVAGLELEAGLTVGYLALFPSAPAFSLEADGGARAVPWLHRFVGGATLGVGYRFGAFTPFLSYDLLIETPFLRKFSPVLPHQLLRVGLRIALPEVKP